MDIIAKCKQNGNTKKNVASHNANEQNQLDDKIHLSEWLLSECAWDKTSTYDGMQR